MKVNILGVSDYLSSAIRDMKYISKKYPSVFSYNECIQAQLSILSFLGNLVNCGRGDVRIYGLEVVI